MRSNDSYVIHTAQIKGAEALPVRVEVSMSQGIPGLTIVGMPDAAVIEARSRVRCALKACGFSIARAHITINLSPGDLRKQGSSYDLPIAVAILALSGQIPRTHLERYLFIGELSLDGWVNATRGSIAYEALAHQMHLSLILAPNSYIVGGRAEVKCLRQLLELRRGVDHLPDLMPDTTALNSHEAELVDYADVADQELPKRALVIAACGHHGLLMVGPPGAGKTMLARRLPTILPTLTDDERNEVLLMRSIAGLDLQETLHGIRPFRAPHHSISRAGLLGGGRPVIPGEISFAHQGVLFLDEFTEFSTTVLQSLRQPMEEHEVRLVRVDGTYVFPCNFQLIAAANPCPCGHLGDSGKTCTCTPTQIQQYQSKIGGPIMDRIDLLVDVARPDTHQLMSDTRSTSSKTMKDQVEGGIAFRTWRVSSEEAQHKSTSKGKEILASFSLDARAAFEGTARRRQLGGRAITRIASVARTIADLAEHEKVLVEDIAEACLYRSRDAL